MIGHECFKLYLPLKLHFTTENFDVFKNPKLKNTTIEIYNKRRDRKIFETLAKRFETPRECVKYYVANFAYGNINFLYSTNQGLDNYNLWNKRRQSITHIFEKDVNFIINLLDMRKIDINNIDTEIFNLYMNSEITLEGIVILNSYNGILSRINDSVSKLIWGGDILRLIKSERFVKFDKNKTDQIYYDFKNEINI